MDTQTPTPATIEYETCQIGAAYFVKDLLKRLCIVEIIDSEMKHQPEIGASYGALAQVVIINRLSFEPQPLYAMEEWAKQHGVEERFPVPIRVRAAMGPARGSNHPCYFLQSPCRAGSQSAERAQAQRMVEHRQGRE